MDYDFTETEFLLVIEIERLTKELLSNRPSGNTAAMVQPALKALARTPYLRLGLEPVPGLNGLATLTAAIEVLASLEPSLCLAIEASTRVFGRMLAAWASPDQKARWLGPLRDGNLIGAIALSEDALNVENDPMQTCGKMDGDRVSIRGRKQWVVNGPIADAVAVVGTLEGRTVVFVVDAATEGLTQGPPLETLGFDGTPFCSLELDNCRINADQIIDPAPTAAIEALRLWENQVLSGISLGLMKTGFEAAKDHAKTHRSGGKPVIAYQQVGFKLAEMLTLYQSAQLLAYRAAWTADNTPKQAPGLALCAKVFATESAEQVTGAALQILAGAGLDRDHRVARAWRCAKYGQIAGTSTEIARVMIGDEALGTERSG